MRVSIVVVGMLLGAACVAWSDGITVKDKTYTDVLIHTSSNFYYITAPTEGRIITVPRSDVDPATVSIVDDPLYRDTLKARYDENRDSPKAKSYQSMDESKVVADAQAAVAAANDARFQMRPDGAMPSGGGMAAAGSASAQGLGVSAAELQQAVQPAGVTMKQQGTQAGHPKFTGRSASGELEVDAYGPEDNLKHLSLLVTATDVGQLQAILMSAGPLLGKIAPWSQQWIIANQANLLTGTPIETTQANVRLLVQVGQSGANIQLTLTFDSAG